MHGHLRAFTMFFDLSGFTSMTETLMQKGNEGAEELSLSLNSIFEPMVQLVYSEGGLIPHFAGDAFIALFPTTEEGEALRMEADRIFHTASRLLHLYKEKGSKSTRFGEFEIGLKIGISLGDVEWGIVGGQQYSFYFRGKAIDECSRCQVLADEQDMVVDQALHELLNRPDRPGEEIKRRYFAYHYEPPAASLVAKADRVPQLKSEILRAFLPPEVIQFDQRGEFRTVTSIFISFLGVDDHQALNELATLVLDQVNGFSGYFKEVDFGDKGGVMVAFFGAPVSFEKIMNRALECVLAIRREVEVLQGRRPGLKLRMGITSGTAYTGLVGGKERCQYAAVGNRVNIAARLMINADWGEVLVDENIEGERGYRFEHKGNIRYKGIEADIPTFVLEGYEEEQQEDYQDRMVGRDEELAQLVEFAQPIFREEFAGLVYVFGEAGLGKSRLVHELREKLSVQRKVGWYVFQADQILKKPFNLFIYFLKNFFGQSPEKTAEGNRREFEARFDRFVEKCRSLPSETDPHLMELVRTRPVLAALIGLVYDNSLWDQLDAKGRRENTFSAILNLIDLLTRLQPTVMVMEDAHWLDNYSREVLQALLRNLRDRATLLLLTARPDDDGKNIYAVSEEVLNQNLIPMLEIDLGALSDQALRKLAEEKLQGPVTDSFFDLLRRTTNGNPFYAEQMLEYFRESGLLKEKTNGEPIDIKEKEKQIKLSNSINSILTARIDRLSNLVKETVKAAAVIGREFEVPVLSEVMRNQDRFNASSAELQAVLREQIKTAERGQIWRAMNELRYIFKHSLLREAVLDMQLRTRTRELHHLIAEAIEKLYVDNLEERYSDLAHHYSEADNIEKAIEYHEKAADRYRRNYQNEAAEEAYGELLNLLREDRLSKRARTMLKLGRVQELVGKWEVAQETFSQALDLARKTDDKILIGRANDRLGHLLILRGQYDEARLYLNVAATYFELEGDRRGIIRAYGNLGDLYFRQGMYDDAKSYFIKSLELGEQENAATSLAQIASNLGLTFMNQGEYDEGIRFQKQQLQHCERANDKQGMAVLYTNMGIVYYEKGDYDEALECYQQGLKLSDELGNKQLMAIGTGCLGSVYQQKGQFDKALENFEQDLEICRELGDQQGIAIAAGLIGELYSVQGQFKEAISHLKQYFELSKQLNYQKGMAKAVNTLGDVYHFLGEYSTSVDYYQRAIDIARKIDNKLVLGYSLVEQCLPLMELNRLDTAERLLTEAGEVAQQLGNRELEFDIRLLKAMLLRAKDQPEKAAELLRELHESAREAEALASASYELWKTLGTPAWRDKALALYQELQQQAPTHIIRTRLSELQAATET